MLRTTNIQGEQLALSFFDVRQLLLLQG